MSERYLLVQLADIGDLVLTTPAIAALREAKPGARIDLYASEYALPLLPDNLVDTLIPFKSSGQSASRAYISPANLRELVGLLRSPYDAVVFFHHFTLRAGLLKFRLIAAASGARRIIGLKNQHVGFLTDTVTDEGFGAVHQAQYWLDLVALLGASNLPRPASVKREPFPLSAPSTVEKADRRRIVMHAGSGGYSRARRWPVARFAEVARQLKGAYEAEIVLVGRHEDDGESVADLLDGAALNLVGKTSLPQLADVIYHADLFVGADSGVMHIAAATGTPVVSIFGPSNADAWKPWTVGGRSVVLRSGVECSPCSYVGHGIGARNGCAARTCMKLVSPDQVLHAARRLIDKDFSADRPMRSANKKAVGGAA